MANRRRIAPLAELGEAQGSVASGESSMDGSTGALVRPMFLRASATERSMAVANAGSSVFG